MKYEFYVVDAFTTNRFGGNPAGVVIIPHDATMSEATMQSIANEVNLPMTSFVQAADSNTFTLLWFNPTAKATFCGHATLAAAHILLTNSTEITLLSPIGELEAKRTSKGITLKFASNPPHRLEPSAQQQSIANEFLGQMPNPPSTQFFYEPTTNDLFILLDSIDDSEFARLSFPSAPENMAGLVGRMESLGIRGVVFVAQSQQANRDSISRVFNVRDKLVVEDQVTGSAHTVIAPLFYEIFGKSAIHAHQCSQRQGQLYLELVGDQVYISGNAVLAIQGNISV
ncbi:hypothetical protein LPJ78_004317 [Coemansia sp. RSA 989]|nr:hypothetical protein BX667DRAFT_503398 [Coemansia mojavensis]KAJ1740579.1 hypothetical protein LPJ68_003647 [Coemansia sp. RSA 1086]KAJ1748918.1 hypothetical protein LPJ79_004153 [Coemansia sp. RSA 1821]KAJ1863042.1 hypothetical protein LPJ78_004317 [Coemansia sp. RSA 989]KAJ1870888.1 hypothetical protein LPJ55_004322 [Coemansia sp. RSA 990]KAJ2646981.1 hypothetical protein IWW40_005031 [Coemansia sp. RSA 1250]KAJ2672708.1 hypothetical protein IWW42_002657 [Coemansia sp. RSA 1085]